MGSIKIAKTILRAPFSFGVCEVARARLLPLVLVLCALFMVGCSLPTYGGHDPEPSGPSYYRVRPGDTLFSISKKFGTSYRSLALLNGLHQPGQLEAGQLLLVSFGSIHGESDDRDRSGAAVRPASLRKSPPFIPSANSELYWPVNSGSLSSGFGARGGGFHDGIDIRGEVGTPVFAAHDGIVAYSDDGLKGYGNLIVLQSRSGMMTVYAHNSRLLVDVGDQVRRGQKISLIGNTGHSTGPHLHFEVRMQDRQRRYMAVDPLPLFQNSPRKGIRYRINESLTPLVAKLSNWVKH